MIRQNQKVLAAIYDDASGAIILFDYERHSRGSLHAKNKLFRPFDVFRNGVFYVISLYGGVLTRRKPV